MQARRIATMLVPPAVSYFSGGQAIDLIGLADVKLELQIAGTTDDAWLKKVITRVSTAATRYCNRKSFATALWQDQIWPRHDAFPWQLPPRLDVLQLSQWPIAVSPCTAGTAPPTMPTLGFVSAAGYAAATRYFVRTSYVTAQGETALSQEATIAVPAANVLTISPPGADAQKRAIGWNAYVATSSFDETLQSTTPVDLSSGWTMPLSGLVNGARPQPSITIVENAPLMPTPLTEGIDFFVDAEIGQITRLYLYDGQPKAWHLPITTIFSAPFLEVPDDLQDAVLQLVKARWFARQIDPMIRSQSAPGVYEETRWFGTGPGGPGDLPVDVAAKLERYRVPSMA